MNLFKKVAVFTDIHFGKKNNSREFNQDCEDFVIWFIEEAKKENITDCIFGGDWHDTRRYINTSTLNYSLSNLERLNEAFDNVWFILGNHDLYYREKREINSVEFAKKFDNIHLINNIVTENDVTFLPWLVEDEWKQVKKLKSKYIFGHLELPKFLMNGSVEMPDKGELKLEAFQENDLVFSGHFHKRQNKGNIWYIGNTFPHNFSDVGDDKRGMMILEWGEEPRFKTWPDQPTFRRMKLSELVENPSSLKPKMRVQVKSDIELTYEESNLLKDELMEGYGLREFTILPNNEDLEGNEDFDVQYLSVDQMVLDSLKSLDSESKYNNTKLMEIYNKLEIDGR